MDRIARVRSCLEGKMTDRPPFSFWQHMRAGEELGQPCIDAHVRLYRNTGIDMVKMMIDGYRDVSEGLKIEKPSDWRSVRFPSVKSPFITGQLDRIKGVMDAIGSEAAVFYHSFTPFSSLRITWGNDSVFAHLLDKESRPHLLYALGELTLRFKEYLELFHQGTGITGMMLTVTGTENNGISDAAHADCIAPSDMEFIEEAMRQSSYTMLHFCGFANRPCRLHLWKEYRAAGATVDIFEDRISLKEAPAFFPHIRAFMGGYDIRNDSLIMTGSKEEIQTMAKQCVKDAGSIPYFVGAANTVPTALDHEHIRWVGEALV